MTAKKAYSMHYGKSEMSFALDPAMVDAELKIKDCPALDDPVAAIRDAIRNPVGSRPLREIVKPGETITFIVNDPTRVANSNVFMPVLIEELNGIGVRDEAMQIVFALGTHRAMTQAEMIETVGADVAGRLKMHNVDCKDDSQFVYFGTTSRGTGVSFHKLVAETNHIICTGSVVHHFFAGFGGGRKALFPGVASYETIRHNHSFMMDPDAVIGKLRGNPIYEDQIEGAEMLRPSFLLNVVLNEKYEFLKVFAGDYIAAHLEACRFVEDVYSTSIDKEADLVIASCGGFPKDINIYQLQKTMDNAWCAVRDGGVVIILGECCEGSGSALYEKTMEECRTPERVAEKLKDNFQIGAHKAYAVTRLMKKARFILVSTLDPNLARTLLFTPAADMDEAFGLASQIVGPSPRIVLMPQGSLTVPMIKK
ncbi:MAG TPA: nickel-dependent lactate racemase [Dissulfurispiraceae bacterium]|nr:nickel-dependent lactate racemase [Dissulfurispiraceae bacterium]